MVATDIQSYYLKQRRSVIEHVVHELILPLDDCPLSVDLSFLLQLGKEAIVEILTEEEKFIFLAKNSSDAVKKRFYRLALQIIREEIKKMRIEKYDIFFDIEKEFFPAIKSFLKILLTIETKLSELDIEDPEERKQKKEEIASYIWKNAEFNNPFFRFVTDFKKTDKELRIFSNFSDLYGVFETISTEMKNVFQNKDSMCIDTRIDEYLKIIQSKVENAEKIKDEKTEILLRVLSMYIEEWRYI